MASVMQKNGLKPLPNGSLIQHVDLNKVCAARAVQQQQPSQQMHYSDETVSHSIVNGQQVLLQHGCIIGHMIGQNDNSSVGVSGNSVPEVKENEGQEQEPNPAHIVQHQQQLQQMHHSDSSVSGMVNGQPGTFQNGQVVEQVNPQVPGNANGVAEDNDFEGPLVIDIGAQANQVEEEPEIDITINNVVCSFSVKCHLNLRQIALRGFNVEYRRENGMVTMKLRRPYTTASIWSSGKITCTGSTSEDQAKIAARRFARCLQKLGFKARFGNFRVVNVLGTCSMPFAIRITAFSEQHRDADYEPELHPGVTYKLKKPKATLKIFSTGSVTVTAPSVASVQAAIEYIYPLVYEFRKERTKEEIIDLKKKLRERRARRRTRNRDAPEDEFLLLSEEEEEEEDEEMEEEEDWK